MSERQVAVAVVGGGPAGMTAALAAAAAGASVALIDEYAAPGGQIWRRRFDEVADAAPASLPAHAAALCARLAASPVEVLSGATVWAAPAPGTLLLTGEVSKVRATAIVVATGAYDRPVAFPGWTLPGVMTAGGAQALAKGQGIVPGKRVLLAGAGPFLLPVAEQLAAKGAEVVAVVEATRRRDWLRAGPRMAAYPARLLDYARYRTAVRRVIWDHVIVRVTGDERVSAAAIAPAGADWAPSGPERTFEVDAVCTAYGFLPAVDLARALGCGLDGDAVAHDQDMATTVPGVFVAGEAAGIGGADLAQVEGELAGWMAATHTRCAARRPLPVTPADLRAARRPPPVTPPDLRAARRPPPVAPPDLRAVPRPPPVAPPDLPALRRRRAKLAGFAGVLSDLFDPRPGLLTLAAPDTVLCRCEDVTAGAIDQAVAAGATTMAALKVVTRCGQGPCQGRTCERLIAARLPEPERFNARAPLRPIPLGRLIDLAAD